MCPSAQNRLLLKLESCRATSILVKFVVIQLRLSLSISRITQKLELSSFLRHPAKKKGRNTSCLHFGELILSPSAKASFPRKGSWGRLHTGKEQEQKNRLLIGQFRNQISIKSRFNQNRSILFTLSLSHLLQGTLSFYFLFFWKDQSGTTP